MRNPNLVPYETIVRATSGEPEAVNEVLRNYGKRIRLAPLKTDTSTRIPGTTSNGGLSLLCLSFVLMNMDEHGV